MVYKGGPSKGCDTCRLRKVKCTEERPYCLRCRKGSFMCLGYHSHSRATLKRMQYRFDTTFTNLISIESEPFSVQITPIPTNVRLAQNKICQLPELSCENRSISFFLDQFVVAQNTGDNIGWFQFLSEFSSQADQFSLLGFALCRQAKKLEEQIQSAIGALDPIWYYGTISARHAARGSNWKMNFRKALVYHDPWTMSMWHAYRVTRISVHAALIRCYGLLSSARPDFETPLVENLEELRRQSLAIIDDMNEDICASIPWSLGQLDQGEHNPANSQPKASRASLSIVGLKTVVNGRFTRMHHSAQARAGLREIGLRSGIKGAL